MKLKLIDVLILCAYLLTTVVLGLWYRNKAKENKDSYLMGGKSMPWYLLGLSNASDMFDISGTMWMVSLCFIYGMKSIWIPWLWPVFNQVFLMMYLSPWLRRSNATTGAEWLESRFGKSGRGVDGSHKVVIAFALLSCLGFLAYGFIGLGKFMEMFIPWSVVQPYVPFHVSPHYVAHFYGIIFTLFALFYSILGGMRSIVVGDFIKYVLMTVSCVGVAYLAMTHLRGHSLNVPNGWYSPFFGSHLNMNWANILSDANKKIDSDGYSLFSIFFMMMLFKGVFASLAGPAPNYDMQKILSTKSPQDASKMSGFVNIMLLPVRYSLVIGLTVLGILYFKDLHLPKGPDGYLDFEMILPAAMNNFLPVGLLGLLLTALLGAFMGTFSGTVNAAQAYIVNDIYLKYFRPNASTRSIIAMNYIVGLIVVAVGVLLGFFTKDVNSILQWIVSALYGGYIAANVLKWHWWRFNANGFFWGMLVGVIAAMVFSAFFSGIQFLYFFPLLFALSLLGCIIGTYAAPATDTETLKRFYKQVRPWGFWKPINDLVVKDDPSFVPNKNFGIDMFNVVLGIIAQLALTILPMYFVLMQKWPFAITLAVLIIIGFILKKTWWNRLKDF